MSTKGGYVVCTFRSIVRSASVEVYMLEDDTVLNLSDKEQKRLGLKDILICYIVILNEETETKDRKNSCNMGNIFDSEDDNV